MATRTYNPLPFKDLEPRRFEDLVRQLAYDFRSWQLLEATGRSGSDDGFDIRGFEQVGEPREPRDNDDEDVAEPHICRLWLVQCKREKEIGPSKMRAHLNSLEVVGQDSVYGVIVATACDISKRTRDVFREWCHSQGVSEGHIWAAGELEDMLFQPKNDGLLFAYFGISLSIRRRSTASRLRAELAMKRKLSRIINISSAPILLRDPDALDYPGASDEVAKRWRVYSPQEVTHRGLRLEVRWHHAIVDPDTGDWDAAFAAIALHIRLDDPWAASPTEQQQQLSGEAALVWDTQPSSRKAWVRVFGYVPISDILAVDEDGDDIFRGTHVYVSFHPETGPFAGPLFQEMHPVNRDLGENFDWLRRAELFPQHLRTRSKEG